MARGKRVEIIKLTVDGVEVDAKVCTKCKGNPKPLSDFHKHKGMLDGHCGRCKECMRRPGAKRYKTWSPDSYREHVCDITGAEYEVLGEYVTNKIPLQMRHSTCGHEWPVKPHHFLDGTRCPECATDLRTKNHGAFVTEVFDLVADEYEVLGEYVGCDIPLHMRHTICRHEWPVNPSNFLRGSRCPACASSKGEARIAAYLSTRGYNYICGYKFDNCRYKRPLPFDVAVITAERAIPIEYDGEHHSRPTDFAGRGAEWAERQFRQIQRNDAIKTEYCRANGIPLIRIKHTEFDEIEAILDRELSALCVTGKRNNTDNNDTTRKEDAA